MKYTPYTLSILAATCLLSGCITAFFPPGLDSHRSLLVVDGLISDGETVIRLTKSIALNPESEEEVGDRWISGALVLVESESGEQFEAFESATPGEYRAEGVELRDEDRYRLHIEWDGEEYASEYRHPQSTPPIDNLELFVKGEDGPLQVRIDVSGEPDGSGYYLWSYEETWEIHARLTANIYLGYRDDVKANYYNSLSLREYYYNSTDNVPENDVAFGEYPNDISPYYYCWGYSNSKELLLGSTERMSENTLRDQVLYEFELYDDRIMYMYHTKIYQFSIDEDAYIYFANQKRNTDESNSIFAPIPTEMEGNIKCITSPDIPAIGFVEVSRRVESEYISQPYSLPYQAERHNCTYFVPNIWSEEGVAAMYNQIYASGYFISYFIPYLGTTGGVMFSTRDCVDCRQRGGTKTRPEWWPNDHR